MRCWLCGSKIEGEPIMHEEVVMNYGGKEEVWKFNFCSRECEVVFTLLFHAALMPDEEVMEHLVTEHGIYPEEVEKSLKKFESPENVKVLRKRVKKLARKIADFAFKGNGDLVGIRVLHHPGKTDP